jgi:type I restriction enzyme S subunit
MNGGWSSKTLGEVLQKTETVNPADSPEAEFEYIDVSSVSNSTFQIEETQRIKGKDAPSRARKLVRANDILFATIRPTLQRIAIVTKNLDKQVCSTGYFVLRPKPELDSRFVFYSLFREEFTRQMETLQKGASYPAVTDGDVRSQVIPVPTLPEQKRIVAILDEAFEGISTAKANAERNLQNARAIFESQLQSIFTRGGKDWVDTTIGDQIRFIDYRGKTPVKTANGIRLITAKNVKMGYLQDTPMEYIAAGNYHAWMTRGIPKKGDVLFTTEAPLANVAQLDTTEKVAFAQRIIIMQAKAEALDNTFLKYLLLSQPIQHRIRTKATGATVQGIKASLLKAIEISYPRSLPEQKRLVDTLKGLSEETQHLASIFEHKLGALDALKKSLLHRAFAGELTADKPSELIEAVA